MRDGGEEEEEGGVIVGSGDTATIPVEIVGEEKIARIQRWVRHLPSNRLCCLFIHSLGNMPIGMYTHVHDYAN